MDPVLDPRMPDHLLLFAARCRRDHVFVLDRVFQVGGGGGFARGDGVLDEDVDAVEVDLVGSATARGGRHGLQLRSRLRLPIAQ